MVKLGLEGKVMDFTNLFMVPLRLQRQLKEFDGQSANFPKTLVAVFLVALVLAVLISKVV
jgi:hypothetical protein